MGQASFNPTVSVIVPAYNEQRWIGACLGSLSAQTHPDYELIVVDDGSTDSTAEIASTYPVKLVRSPHQGCGAARDIGASVAAGDVLVFLDADEIYAADFVEELVSPLADPAVNGTFPGTVTLLNPCQGLAPGWLYIRGRRDNKPVDYGAEHRWPKAVRRVDFERVGGYPRIGYGEDQFFGARIGPAKVVRSARWWFTLPTSPGEVFAKARWIGRGPLFEDRRPPLRKLLPPTSLSLAFALLRARRPRAAVVRVLYDTGRLLGYTESRLRPSLRQRA